MGRGISIDRYVYISNIMILVHLEPFKKFGVGGGGGQKAFESSALVQTLDLDFKLGPS